MGEGANLGPEEGARNENLGKIWHMRDVYMSPKSGGLT